MDVTNYQADHVCYRTETVYEYNRLVKVLLADTNNIHLLVESEIGGRSIATFKLTVLSLNDCTHRLFLYDSIHDQLDNWSHPYHVDY